MAAGISQPTPNGGNILYEDDAHADASGDGVAGSYGAEDWYQKVVAMGWKAADGVTPAIEKRTGATPHYVSHVSIQNGDGSGTATTTWRDSRIKIDFDAGKTHLFSGTGTANRWAKLGKVIDDGVNPPFGYDGVDATFGLSTTFNGQNQIYGSHLRTVVASGNALLTIRRSAGGESDLVDSILEVVGPGVAAIGIGFTTTIRRAIGNKFIVTAPTAANSGLTSYGTDSASNNQVAGASPQYLINVFNAPVFTIDTRLAGTPTVADILGSTPGEDHVDLTWSKRAAQMGVRGPATDWRTWLPTIVDASGNPASGKLAELVNAAGAVVVSATSDSRGQIAYTTSGYSGHVISGAAKARLWAFDTGWTEQGPFTVKIDGQKVLTFAWPRTQYTVGGTVYDQLLPVRDTIGPAETLKANFSVNPGGGQPSLSVQFTDRSTTRPLDTITAWLWSFGDGQTSTAQNPSHTYSAAGLYAVTLTVTDASGQVSESDVAAIYVAAVPGSYVRQSVPATPFVPIDVPGTQFATQDVPATPFVRTIEPASAFTPCRENTPVVEETGEYVIFGDVVLPVEVEVPAFTHRSRPATAFARKPVTAVEYGECGAPTEKTEEFVIFGDVVLPVA